MNATEPPQIVFEQPAGCSDAARAEEALRAALAPSRAPATKWTVRLRVGREHGSLRADGEVTDTNGALVAQRTLDRDSNECTALARAIGVWASLVIDDEVQRALVRDAKAAAESAHVATRVWPAPALPARPSPEAETFLAHDPNARSFELGVSTELMAGTGAGMIAGASFFMVTEVANGWFLRPAIALGRTTQEITSSSDVYATWGAARLDACKRLPGNYLDKRGIQLDLCGGADMGFMHFDAPTPPANVPAPSTAGGRTNPFVAVGPSIAFRGELGGDLSLWIRGIAELNVIPTSFVDGNGTDVQPSLFIGRAELGISWRVR